jgi:AraC family L-rhamnose operon regulatory protein RhaS
MSTPYSPDTCDSLVEAVERGEVNLVAHARKQYPGPYRLSGNELPGLQTIGYWDARGPQNWGLPMHRNEGIEICYLLSGEMTLRTDQNTWELMPGSITVTRPWQRHALGNPHIKSGCLFWLILDVENKPNGTQWEFPSWVAPDAETRLELLRIFRKNQLCHFHDEHRSMMGYLTEACRQMNGEGGLMTAHLAAVVNHVLITVARQLSADVKDERIDPHGFNQTIYQFFHELELSVDAAAEHWTVKSIAHSCRVGVTYLTRTCREMFNTTPMEQVMRIRLAHAMQLLRGAPDRTVTEIAMATGFSSSQNFATRFKKQYQRTPQQARRAPSYPLIKNPNLSPDRGDKSC